MDPGGAINVHRGLNISFGLWVLPMWAWSIHHRPCVFLLPVTGHPVPCVCFTVSVDLSLCH